MALINCHECGGKVSTEADACPHCGARPKLSSVSASRGNAVPAAPKNKASPIVRFGGGFLLAIFALLILVSMNNGTSQQKPVASQSACAKDDLQCLGDKAAVGAGIYCKDPIERMAKHSVRWTDGTFGLKFTHFRWADKASGSLTMVGDKAEFQNGFGAYTPVIYECDLAADNKTVLDVRVREGRL